MSGARLGRKTVLGVPVAFNWAVRARNLYFQLVQKTRAGQSEYGQSPDSVRSQFSSIGVDSKVVSEFLSY